MAAVWLSLCLLAVSPPVPVYHCGRCCSLLLSVLCNRNQSQAPATAWRSVLLEAKWTHHSFPLDRVTQQLQMIAVKGKACWQTCCTHIGHLFCCYCKQIQALICFWFFFFFHYPHSKIYSLHHALLESHKNKKTNFFHAQFVICAVEWRRAARAGSVLLELCGVLQQVFICQFSGCHCPSLLKTSHGISWHCHGPRHHFTHEHACECVCGCLLTQSHMICRDIYHQMK